jgi:hypothetical protein
MIAMIRLDWAEVRRIGGLPFATNQRSVNGYPIFGCPIAERFSSDHLEGRLLRQRPNLWWVRGSLIP